jgi:hypothetical protein
MTMLSVVLPAAITAALVLGASSTVLAASDTNKVSTAADALTGTNHQSSGRRYTGLERAAMQAARLPWQAPLGHRQPRAMDVPDKVMAFPSELSEQQLDRELDRRLVICRGC